MPVMLSGWLAKSVSVETVEGRTWCSLHGDRFRPEVRVADAAGFRCTLDRAEHGIRRTTGRRQAAATHNQLVSIVDDKLHESANIHAGVTLECVPREKSA